MSGWNHRRIKEVNLDLCPDVFDRNLSIDKVEFQGFESELEDLDGFRYKYADILLQFNLIYLNLLFIQNNFVLFSLRNWVFWRCIFSFEIGHEGIFEIEGFDEHLAWG